MPRMHVLPAVNVGKGMHTHASIPLLPKSMVCSLPGLHLSEMEVVQFWVPSLNPACITLYHIKLVSWTRQAADHALLKYIKGVEQAPHHLLLFPWFFLSTK